MWFDSFFFLPLPCAYLSTAYSTFYIVGLVLSMQIPFVGFQPIRTSEHMAAAGKSDGLFHFWTGSAGAKSELTDNRQKKKRNLANPYYHKAAPSVSANEKRCTLNDRLAR